VATLGMRSIFEPISVAFQPHFTGARAGVSSFFWSQKKSESHDSDFPDLPPDFPGFGQELLFWTHESHQ
jgi:hypothetical protein